ncbi:MAG: hypothetical protein RI984_1033, partial [Pseudomonadota bacterium]
MVIFGRAADYTSQYRNGEQLI